MNTPSWDRRRKILLGTALCAAVVAVGAFVLVVAGGSGFDGGGQVRLAVAPGPSLAFEQPHSVVSPMRAPVAAEPTTAAPAPAPAPAPVATPAAAAAAAQPAAPAKVPAQPAKVAVPAAKPAPAITSTTAAPIPACRPDDLAATAATDHPSYSQDGIVNATGTITNVSGHDCTAPVDVETLWCDGGNATCISAAGPINGNATSQLWPAGQVRRAADSWEFGTGPGKFMPHPGTAQVKFTWHLANDGAVASAPATFQITGTPAGSTTSTSAPGSSTP